MMVDIFQRNIQSHDRSIHIVVQFAQDLHER
jgi:hypothetical protein